MTVTVEVPQHMQALRMATAAKIERAEVRRELKALPRPAGMLAVAEMLERPCSGVLRVTLYDLVHWVRRMPHGAVLKLLEEAGASEFTTVESVTDRQRDVLCAELRKVRGTVEVVDLVGAET